jgi:hypothetical protein
MAEPTPSRKAGEGTSPMAVYVPDGQSLQEPAPLPESVFSSSRRYRHLNRFNYFRIPEINPWAAELGGFQNAEDVAQLAHQALSHYWRDRFVNGDDEAPLKFARADAWAYRAGWVQQLLEHWADSGDASRVRAFATAFTDRRGRTSLEELLEVIRRDQQALVEVNSAIDEGHTVEAGVARAAERVGLGEDSVWLVYQKYQSFIESAASRFTRADLFIELNAMVARITP